VGEAQAEAIEGLSREVRRLFHQLRDAAEGVAGARAPLPAGQRAVLESLRELGPLTVPALARMRPVARQHVQLLVNGLLAAGLVAARPNPAHRRSPLIELTAAGRRRFDALRQRERAALAALRLPVGERELRAAADTLAALRGALAAAFPASRRRR
jgi:DNA-binding MarR family transcriptional regulator